MIIQGFNYSDIKSYPSVPINVYHPQIQRPPYTPPSPGRPMIIRETGGPVPVITAILESRGESVRLGIPGTWLRRALRARGRKLCGTADTYKHRLRYCMLGYYRAAIDGQWVANERWLPTLVCRYIWRRSWEGERLNLDARDIRALVMPPLHLTLKLLSDNFRNSQARDMDWNWADGLIVVSKT